MNRELKIVIPVGEGDGSSDRDPSLEIYVNNGAKLPPGKQKEIVDALWPIVNPPSGGAPPTAAPAV